MSNLNKKPVAMTVHQRKMVVYCTNEQDRKKKKKKKKTMLTVMWTSGSVHLSALNKDLIISNPILDVKVNGQFATGSPASV